MPQLPPATCFPYHLQQAFCQSIVASFLRATPACVLVRHALVMDQNLPPVNFFGTFAKAQSRPSYVLLHACAFFRSTCLKRPTGDLLSRKVAFTSPVPLATSRTKNLLSCISSDTSLDSSRRASPPHVRVSAETALTLPLFWTPFSCSACIMVYLYTTIDACKTALACDGLREGPTFADRCPLFATFLDASSLLHCLLVSSLYKPAQSPVCQRHHRASLNWWPLQILHQKQPTLHSLSRKGSSPLRLSP